MRLEEQVVSLELAKKLKALNVKQESLLYWVDHGDHEPYIAEPEEGKPQEFEVSAFTVAELLGMLKEMGKQSVIIPLQPLDKNPADYLARYVISEKTKV